MILNRYQCKSRDLNIPEQKKVAVSDCIRVCLLLFFFFKVNSTPNLGLNSRLQYQELHILQTELARHPIVLQF